MLCRTDLSVDRADRHHPADRHREEERDHDDRLRARGRAHARASRRDEAIYQACLLRFRPIMMTTMAALLGGVAAGARHRHRLGAAPAARHRDRRRPDLQPGADALHDAGHLPVRSTGWRRASASALPQPTQRRRRRSGVRHEPLDAVHPPAGRHDAADGRDRAGGRARRITCLPVSPLPQVEFPTIQVSAALARREPRDDGVGGGHAARAAVRPHRRHHRDDVDQLRSARRRSRCSSTSNRNIDARRARRAGGDQRGARAAAGEPAEQSDLSQGQSRRRADHDPGADVRRRTTSAQHVRRRLVDPAAEAVAGRRRRPGDRRRRRAAGGARRGQSDRR